MPKTVIEQFKSKEEVFDKWGMGDYRYTESLFNETLVISEMFGDTLQGEGIWAGHTATFLRLTGCTLDCVWCDTAEVWRKGSSYAIGDILLLLEEAELIEKLRQGQHLVLTGGSPLKQQKGLLALIRAFEKNYHFKPYIEVENECVLTPTVEFAELVDCWNNSPKLSNSGMKARARYKPDVIKVTASLPNSWFKFVVNNEEDWNEIYGEFIGKNAGGYSNGLISKDQVILMPCGQTQAELAISREIAAEMAIKNGVLFSDRLHVTIWDKKTGV